MGCTILLTHCFQTYLNYTHRSCDKVVVLSCLHVCAVLNSICPALTDECLGQRDPSIIPSSAATAACPGPITPERELLSSKGVSKSDIWGVGKRPCQLEEVPTREHESSHHTIPCRSLVCSSFAFVSSRWL